MRQLFEEVRGLLTEDLPLLGRFDTVFYSCLGSGWADALDEAFDWEVATESLAFYAAETIPRPDNPIPESVTDVRFRSDLSSVPLIPLTQLQQTGGLFEASAP